MLKKYEPALIKIEREVGVDRYSLLAIWGRETAFGTYKLPHDAVRVLATEKLTTGGARRCSGKKSSPLSRCCKWACRGR